MPPPTTKPSDSGIGKVITSAKEDMWRLLAKHGPWAFFAVIFLSLLLVVSWWLIVPLVESSRRTQDAAIESMKDMATAVNNLNSTLAGMEKSQIRAEAMQEKTYHQQVEAATTMKTFVEGVEKCHAEQLKNQRDRGEGQQKILDAIKEHSESAVEYGRMAAEVVSTARDTIQEIKAMRKESNDLTREIVDEIKALRKEADGGG